MGAIFKIKWILEVEKKFKMAPIFVHISLDVSVNCTLLSFLTLLLRLGSIMSLQPIKGPNTFVHAYDSLFLHA